MCRACWTPAPRPGSSVRGCDGLTTPQHRHRALPSSPNPRRFPGTNFGPVVLACILVSFVSVAPSAYAESSSGARAQAQQHFRRGMELIEEESWEQALAAFDESLRLYPSQTALFNRAVCQGLMGLPLEATESFRDLLDRHRDTITEERRARANEELERLSRRLGRIHVRVEGPESASVSVDGDDVGATPLSEPLSVNPGRHQVEVRAPNFTPLSRWVDVGAGGVLDVVLILEAASDTAPGEGDVAGDEDGAGEADNEQAAPAGRAARISAYASTGVAVAALGTALGLFLWNRSEFDAWGSEDHAIREALSAAVPTDQAEIDDRISTNRDLQDRIDQVSVVSWVMLGLGSAAAVASLILYVVAPRLERRGRASLVVAPGGLVLVGQW